MKKLLLSLLLVCGFAHGQYVSLTKNVSGILPVANGGTGASSGTWLFAGGPLGTPSSGVATNLTGTASALNIGGNAATVTTNANLTGDVTSVGNATTLTNAPVIAKVLTGYVSGAGTISASDTILSAIQKLNGNNATNANLTGPITSVGNATAVAAQTGTGTTFVMQASPTLTTPVLGVATATSINKMAITAPASSSTLAIADGKTHTVNNSVAISGTDGTTMTFPGTNATIARTDAANTFTGHQTIEGVTSTGATGTGQFVFDTGATISAATLSESTGAAWTAYTPTITADSGTWNAGTITVARYRLLGKTLILNLDVNDTISAGTPGQLRVSLPLSKTAASASKTPAHVEHNSIAELGNVFTVATLGFVAFVRSSGTAFTTGTCRGAVTIVVETQ